MQTRQSRFSHPCLEYQLRDILPGSNQQLKQRLDKLCVDQVRECISIHLHIFDELIKGLCIWRSTSVWYQQTNRPLTGFKLFELKVKPAVQQPQVVWTMISVLTQQNPDLALLSFFFPILCTSLAALSGIKAHYRKQTLTSAASWWHNATGDWYFHPLKIE